MRKLLSYMALSHSRLISVYRKVCHPNGTEWGEYVRRFGGLHSMGSDCLVEADAIIVDPSYVRLGNNVHLSACRLVLYFIGETDGLCSIASGHLEKPNYFVKLAFSAPDCVG